MVEHEGNNGSLEHEMIMQVGKEAKEREHHDKKFCYKSITPNGPFLSVYYLLIRYMLPLR